MRATCSSGALCGTATSSCSTLSAQNSGSCPGGISCCSTPSAQNSGSCPDGSTLAPRCHLLRNRYDLPALLSAPTLTLLIHSLCSSTMHSTAIVFALPLLRTHSLPVSFTFRQPSKHEPFLQSSSFWSTPKSPPTSLSTGPPNSQTPLSQSTPCYSTDSNPMPVICSSVLILLCLWSISKSPLPTSCRCFCPILSCHPCPCCSLVGSGLIAFRILIVFSGWARLRLKAFSLYCPNWCIHSLFPPVFSLL